MNPSSSSQSDKTAIPANLRFQRRTSERAFYEGAFKPGNNYINTSDYNNINDSTSSSHSNAGMDYSAAMSSDPDHPAGSSPWASNSPSQSRTNIGNAFNNDVPQNSLSQSQSPYGGGGASSYDRGSVENLGGARPSTRGSSTLVGSENGDSTDSPYQPHFQSHASQSQVPGMRYPSSQQQDQQGQYQQQDQRQYQQNPRQQQQSGVSESTQPQRYHSTRPHPQQQASKPGPQYKLHVKITGLERSGRKDAVFVFDAHVRHTPCPLRSIAPSSLPSC